MSAYPAFLGSNSQSVLSPSPSTHLKGFGSSTSTSEYSKVQSAVAEGLLNTQASQSCPRFTGSPFLLRNGDGDHSALMADSDRFAHPRSGLYSPPQQRFMMEDIPMGKSLTPSAGASPASQSKSGGAPAEGETQSEEEDELALTASEVDENAIDVGIPRVGVERPAERRKLKRFRLTHNQTRFLTSEFTRQAHPDVAQRERLSREIPGLSPRQVQVWFQNRRAKLKRLTGDDQERVIKSRAPPEDFDTAQALRSAFGGYPRSVETPLTSPTYSTTFVDIGMTRTSLVDNFRRQDDRTTSPNSMHSVSVNYYTSSSSYPASENLSPVSSMSESSHILGPPASHIPGQSSTSSFARCSSFPALYHAYPNIQELQIREEVANQQANPLASPTSLNYSTSNSPVPGEPGLLGDSGPPYLAQHDQLGNNASDTTPTLGGSGHGTLQGAVFPRADVHTLMDSQWQDFQNTGLEFTGPVVPPLPAHLDMPQPYGPVDGLPNTTGTQTSQNMQSAPLAVHQNFQLPRAGGLQYATAYNLPYSATYINQAPYSNPFPMAHEGLIGEQVAEPYTSDVGFGTSSQQPLPIGLDNIKSGTKTLRPKHQMGRRRSFTHPMDTSSSR